MNKDANQICFVCDKNLSTIEHTINKKVMLPVCASCKASDKEKKKEDELLDSLADGLFCGCI
jgi:NMD protein affecting ribosome stability and mRNA decay